MNLALQTAQWGGRATPCGGWPDQSPVRSFSGLS